MSNKKSEETDKSAELQALERRVDAIMNTEPSSKPATKTSPSTKKTSSLRVITDHPDQRKTAPELSPKQLSHIEPDKATAVEPVPEPPEKPSLEPAPEPTAKPTVGVPEVPTEPVKADAKVEPAKVPPTKTILDDSETDKAVEDIVIREGDTQLAVDDALARQRAAELEHQPGLIGRFFTNPWTWLFIIGIAAVTYAWYH